mgnify:CR=1 FL=1
MGRQEELVKEIVNKFDTHQLELPARLEVIANVLLREGLDNIPPEYIPDTTTPENLINTIMLAREEMGETLGVATAHQGLVLLMWLESIK